MIFWLLAGAATALCVALLLRPLLRRSSPDSPRVEYDLRVYRDQLAEVERDVARGVLRPDQAEAARGEVERRMLASADAENSDTQEATASAAPRPSLWLAAATTLLLPAAAVTLYLWLGVPGLPSLPLTERPPAAGQPENLIAEARAQVEREPGNREAWRVLGGLYVHQDRFDEAVAAYRRLLELAPEDRDTMGVLAEILIARADGEVAREARLLLAEIIKADPGNPRARYYAALAMSQDGMLREALDIWSGLLRDSTPDAPWLPLVQSQVRAVAAALGLDESSLSEILAPQSPPSPALPAGPSKDDVAAAAELSDEERIAFIRSMVERLAARLQDEPEDLQGWLRLARAYQVLGDLDQARTALERAQSAAANLPADAPLRKSLADALEALPASN